MKKLSLLIFFFCMFTLMLNAQITNSTRIKIGLVADIQYADAPTAGSRHYRASLQKLPVMVEIMNRSQLDFVVDLGDRIDRDFVSFIAVDSILEQLNSPLYMVPGNHDFSVQDRFKKRVIKKTGSPAGYHSKVKGDWRFIFLNGLDNSLVAHPDNTYKYKKANKELKKLVANKKANAYDWNGGFNIRQEKWMIKELRKARENNQHVILFCHQPLTPGNVHSLWNNQHILALLSEYPDEVYWINGHDHHGGYEKIGNVHLITLHGMVEGDNPSFAILRIEGNKVSFEGFGDQTNIKL